MKNKRTPFNLGRFVKSIFWDDRYDMPTISGVIVLVASFIFILIFVLSVVIPDKFEQYDYYHDRCMQAERYTLKQCDVMALEFADGD